MLTDSFVIEKGYAGRGRMTFHRDKERLRPYIPLEVNVSRIVVFSMNSSLLLVLA